MRHGVLHSKVLGIQQNHKHDSIPSKCSCKGHSTTSASWGGLYFGFFKVALQCMTFQSIHIRIIVPVSAAMLPDVVIDIPQQNPGSTCYSWTSLSIGLGLLFPNIWKVICSVTASRRHETISFLHQKERLPVISKMKTSLLCIALLTALGLLSSEKVQTDIFA